MHSPSLRASQTEIQAFLSCGPAPKPSKQSNSSALGALQKSAEIPQRHKARLQGSLFQFISRYSREIRVFILYHRNPIQTLIWHPIAWASCDQTVTARVAYCVMVEN